VPPARDGGVSRGRLVVEANDSAALREGARSLAVRVARAVNRAAGRSGRVLDDRYHTRALRTPREVRFALAYVLFHFKKHQVPTRLDPCSSVAWCDGVQGRAAALAAPRPPLDERGPGRAMSHGVQPATGRTSYRMAGRSSSGPSCS